MTSRAHPPDKDPPFVESSSYVLMVQQATDLHFLAKLLTFDLDKGSGHSLLVGVEIAKSDPPAANWVPVLVRVYSSIHHTLGKEIGVNVQFRVSSPPNRSPKIVASPSALSIPCKAPTKAVFRGSSHCNGLWR